MQISNNLYANHVFVLAIPSLSLSLSLCEGLCGDVFRGGPCCLTGPGKKEELKGSLALVKSSNTLRPMVKPEHIFTDSNEAENTIPEIGDELKAQLMARWEIEWFPGVLLMED
jgi:hypothetical protein